jgi:hypothetical protein
MLGTVIGGYAWMEPIPMLGTSYGRGEVVPMLGTVGAGEAGGVLSPMLGTSYARGDEIPMLGTVAGGRACGVLIPMLGTVWGGGGQLWASAGRTVKSPLVASATSSAIRLVIPPPASRRCSAWVDSSRKDPLLLKWLAEP